MAEQEEYTVLKFYSPDGTESWELTLNEGLGLFTEELKADIKPAEKVFKIMGSIELVTAAPDELHLQQVEEFFGVALNVLARFQKHGKHTSTEYHV